MNPRAMRARILTVEDDPIVRADLRLILEDANFEVSEAGDGIEAITRARHDRPDLIVLDLGLPKLDGVSAAGRIRREHAIPIIALTGRTNEDGHARAIAAGATHLVLKPFGVHELLTKVREALATSTTRDRTDDRPPEALLDGDDHQLRILVESLVARGYSQREIERELRRHAR